ncbi:hypothetical protein OG455_10310 [Kitasatospora sp. NBC_01287]|uniref:hypothetical protein n=1 Tax=Kitasatospora sp. NBC_01287 TaxID=2903573 RepID=UPI002258F38F|nr:hypothetical protein [Kitasatospora sp. NBC_01287]MCX4745913.1 hypothetical protein [Kitasatospora sp. NBC_01287]
MTVRQDAVEVNVVVTAPNHGIGLWMLGAFVVTFVVTRVVTRLIRAGRGPFRNVEVGGTHVHHQVYGIMAMVVAGAVEFSYRPGTPGAQILAVLFGAGAALTLDEFALWLHLKDVYWASEGRKSVDAAFLAAAVGLLLVAGFNPFADTGGGTADHLAFAIGLLINLALCLGAILKGKTALGVIGLLVPFVALTACLRLAKPGSPWARWRYPPDGRKAERALRRFPPGRRTRLDALKDLVGGTPQR